MPTKRRRGNARVGVDFLATMPDEIVLRICEYMSPVGLVQLATCSHRYLDLIRGERWPTKAFPTVEKVNAQQFFNIFFRWPNISNLLLNSWPTDVLVARMMRRMHRLGDTKIYFMTLTCGNCCAGRSRQSNHSHMCLLTLSYIERNAHISGRTTDEIYEWETEDDTYKEGKLWDTGHEDYYTVDPDPDAHSNNGDGDDDDGGRIWDSSRYDKSGLPGEKFTSESSRE